MNSRSTFSSLLTMAKLFAVAGAALVGMLGGTVSAFKRRAHPLTVAALEADAVVVARVTKIEGRPGSREGQAARVDVSEVWKGTLPKGNRSIQINPDQGYMPVGPLREDGQYILFLRPAGIDRAKQEVMLDGTQLHTEAGAAAVQSVLALTPAWSEPQEGIATALVPESYRIKLGDELNLFFVCRNETADTIVLHYRNSPLATHTHWKLEIQGPDGRKIAPLDHPTLTRGAIEAYFSGHPHSYKVPLLPGQDYFFALTMVSSAKPGWGHKEQLDFRYYPLVRAGAYEIAAKGYHLLPKSVLSTKPFRLWIE